MAKFFKARGLLLILLLTLSIGLSIDLYWPLRRDIRVFNPKEIARLDAQMWRSYYDRKPLQLFSQLTHLLQTQYKAPPLRSCLMAYYATRAAFAFKRGKNYADYQQALPHLISLYTRIRQMSREDFAVEKAASLELQWWIIHRQRQTHSTADLEQALAHTAAEVYHISPLQTITHARLRVQAMSLRDLKAAQGGLTEQDWQQIQALLTQSWQSLWEAVNKST